MCIFWRSSENLNSVTLTYNSVTLTYLHEVEDGRITVEYVRQQHLGTSQCVNLMLTMILTALEVSKVPAEYPDIAQCNM